MATSTADLRLHGRTYRATGLIASVLVTLALVIPVGTDIAHAGRAHASISEFLGRNNTSTAQANRPRETVHSPFLSASPRKPIHVKLSVSAPDNTPTYGSRITLTAGVRPTFPKAPIGSGKLQPDNPIIEENKRPGTTSWKPTKPAPGELTLSGWASATSVNHGSNVTLYITDDAGPEMLTLDVYRMGWYQGAGARLVEDIPNVSGQTQPPCTVDSLRMVSCANWAPTYTLRTGAIWVSGDYIVKVTDARGYQTYISLTVRNDSSRAPFVVQNSVNTWETYNYWGGYSLYVSYDPSTGAFGTQRGYAVSFDRPYRTNGLTYFLDYEFNDVSWFERHGYNVTYTTDSDTDLHPRSLLQHKALLVLGHSEYWSRSMRQGVLAARHTGVSLAFLGGNDIYYHIRYSSDALGADRIIVCYKSYWLDPQYGHDNAIVTGRWRDAPNNLPENSIVGGNWEGDVSVPQPFEVRDAAGWEYAHTGAKSGQISPQDPVNGEYNTVVDNGLSPPGVTILGASPAIPITSPEYGPHSLQYEAQCPISGPGPPDSVSLTLRSRVAYSIQLMLTTSTGSIMKLAFDSLSTAGELDYRDFQMDIAPQAPLDGAWHTVTLHPSADLARLGAPAAASIVGVWVGGDVDVGRIKVSGLAGKDGQRYQVVAGPHCDWTSNCPHSAPAFCSTLGTTGVIDGTAERANDAHVGEYVRFQTVPAVADTTMYQARSGALVFDAGNYGWDSGLTGAGNGITYDYAPWSIIDGLMANVLNQMEAASASTGSVTFTSGTKKLGTVTVWNGQPVSINVNLSAGRHIISAAYKPGVSGNYRNPGARKVIVVKPAPLTVTAGDVAMELGGPSPSIPVTYSGFVNGDSASSALSGRPRCTTTATTHTPVKGTYSTNCHLGTLKSPNYVFAFQSGVLTEYPNSASDR